MRSLKVYQVISYILLPFGAFMGFMALISLLASFGNPAILLLVFIMGSVSIYVFTSFHFFQNGLVRKQALKFSLKDWIKVNGYVALFFSIMTIVQGYYVVFHPEVLQENFKTVEEMAIMPGAKKIDSHLFIKVATGFLYMFLFFCTLMFVHIMQSVRFIRQYQQVFSR